MKKKLLSIMLCVMLVVGMLPTTVLATSTSVSDTDVCVHEYSWKSDYYVHWKECSKCGEKNETADHNFENKKCTVCKDTCLWAEGLKSELLVNGTYALSVDGTNIYNTLVIPKYYQGKIVTKIGVRGENTEETPVKQSYQNIILPDSITILERFAFMNCPALREITIPNSVKIIDQRTFEGCISLEKVILPKSIVEISVYIFSKIGVEIEYKGSMKDWEKIGRGIDWDSSLENSYLCPTITCTDGTIKNHKFEERATWRDPWHHWTRSCVCGEREFVGYERHTGGTGNCTEKGTCTVCGEEYFCHTWSTEWYATGSDSYHSNKCTKCDAEGPDDQGHTFEWKNEGTEHWQECTVCGQECNRGSHSGGTATCMEKATCTACGTKYGELAGTHTGGTATCTEQATCEICHTKYGELAPHTGGYATCTEKAVCTACNQPYGELHNYESTWHKDSNSHWQECKDCGVAKRNEKAHQYDESKWSGNSSKHWHECICGAKKDEAEHTYNSSNSIQAYSVCDICKKSLESNSSIIGGGITSITISSAQEPIIEVQPENGANPLTISATVTDGGNLCYQWYKNGIAIEGGTNSSYIPDVGTHTYYCVVTNIKKSLLVGETTKAATTKSNEVTVTANQKQYTVTFNTNGGSDVASQTIKENATATRPETDPTKAGHAFAGWYTDAEFTQEYDFRTNVTKDITLYAKWNHVHAWEDTWRNNETYHWHNCTAPGCGIVTNDSKNGYGEHTSSGPATEDTAEICTVCNCVLAPALGHQCSLHLRYVSSKNASCTRTGNRAYYQCTTSTCGKLYLNQAATQETTLAEVTISSYGHNYSNATCTEPRICQRCETTLGTALGHSFTNYISDGNATCMEDGTETAKCDRCEVTDQRRKEDSALGHDLATEWSRNTENHWHICSRCDFLGGNAAHTPGKVATETNAQTCTVCGYEIAPKLMHNPALVKGYAATVSENGKKDYYHCNACGKNYEDAAGLKEITGDIEKWRVIPMLITNTESESGNASTIVDITEDGNEAEDGKNEIVIGKDLGDEIIKNATNNDAKDIVLNAVTSAQDVTSSEVALPSEMLKNIADQTTAGVTFQTNSGEVSFDEIAVKAVAAQIGTSEAVKFVVNTEETTEDHVKLDLKIFAGEKTVGNFHGGKAKIKVAISEDLAKNDPVCAYIDDANKYELVGGEMEEDQSEFGFMTTHFSRFEILPRVRANAIIAAQEEADNPKPISIAKAKVTGISNKKYTGKAIKQSLSVTVQGKKLVANKDYTVSYRKNTNVGLASVTITGKGAYTGKITKTFKINPKGTSLKKLKGAKKSVKVTWTKQLAKMKSSRISGYQIQYSTSKKFVSGKTKTKKVSFNKTISTKTITGLKAKKKYYIRIRTYKKVSGKTYYSSWSKVKSVKTK